MFSNKEHSRRHLLKIKKNILKGKSREYPLSLKNIEHGTEKNNSCTLVQGAKIPGWFPTSYTSDIPTPRWPGQGGRKNAKNGTM